MGNSSVPSNADGYDTTTGVGVNDTAALGLTAFYACVRLLADSIASLPWDAYRKGDGERVRREVTPAPSLLRKPAPQMTAFDWKHMAMVSMVIRGNFYGLIVERDALEYPTLIDPLHPDQVRIDRDENLEKRVYVRGKRIS